MIMLAEPPDPRSIAREMIRMKKRSATFCGRRYFLTESLLYADMEGKGPPNNRWASDGEYYKNYDDHSVWLKSKGVWNYIRRLPFGSRRKSIGLHIRLDMYGEEELKGENGEWIERPGLWSQVYEYKSIQ